MRRYLLSAVLSALAAVGCAGDQLGDDHLPGAVDVADDGAGTDASDGADEASRDDSGRDDAGTDDWTAPDDGGADDAAPDVPMTACDRWRDQYPERSAWVWRAGATQCDVGEIDPVAIDDAVRRVNLYRSLVGLPGIVGNAEFSRKAQHCAVLMAAMRTLDHAPPPTATCYTPEAAEAAGSSNLAMGTGSPAQAVDLFIEDGGVRSLGHRRWILYPRYSQGGFGHAHGYQCQWVFGWGVDPGVGFVAYPGPGEFPIQALRGAWSLSAEASFDGATVEVTRVADGVAVPVSGTWLPDPGFGQPTIAWYVPGAGPGAYRVRVAGGSRTFDYSTTLVDCR